MTNEGMAAAELLKSSAPLHGLTTITIQKFLQLVAEMGKKATNSMRSVPAALRYLAVVVVQDALEDATGMPENPVHAYLLQNAVFQYVSPCALL